MIIWFWLIAKNKIPKNIFKETFRFGFGYFFISLIWIVEPFFVEPWIHGWIAPIALIALPSFLALIWALFAFFGHYFLSSVGIVIGLSLAEYCRLYLLTGFPWATISYVLLDTEAEKWLSLIGPYGLSLFLLFTCFLIAFAFQTRKKLNAFLAVSTTSILFLIPHFFGKENSQSLSVSVRLIQPNAVQEKKWSEEFAPVFFKNMIEMTSHKPKPDIVIWPETSLYLPYNSAFEELDKMGNIKWEYINRASNNNIYLLNWSRYYKSLNENILNKIKNKNCD